MATTEKQKPVLVKKRFPLEAALFRFEDDDKRPSYSIKLSHSFRRKGKSEWETRVIFFPLSITLSACELLREFASDAQDRLQHDYDERREERRDAVGAETELEEAAF